MYFELGTEARYSGKCVFCLSIGSRFFSIYEKNKKGKFLKYIYEKNKKRRQDFRKFKIRLNVSYCVRSLDIFRKKIFLDGFI